ncbi:alpha/beta fold hydrolase, partial [Amycolatopsis bartoniae]
MRTVISGGVRLAVFEEGPRDAPTVVLVHGYPDTHAVWDDVAAALASRFHVVRYDVRGAGRSDVPRGTAAYRLEHLKNDLFAVLDAVSPDAPVHLVAHDWGSLQSWEAVTEPGAHTRIASYTSISGPCLDHVAHWMRRPLTPRRLKQVVTQQLHSWYILAFHVPVLPELLWRTVVAKRWPHLLRRVENVPPRP